MGLFEKLEEPKDGSKITVNKDFSLDVPDDPIIPYITGDGTGRDISAATLPVLEAAVAKTFAGKKRICWFKIYVGDEARFHYYGDKSDDELKKLPEVELRRVYLPDDSERAIKEYRVAIKGPLTTPVGGGIRSLNVSLRQDLDLFACVRPVKYYGEIPSPVRRPELMDLIIFRENTEDVYAGIEWESGGPDAGKVISFLNRELLPQMKKNLRQDSGIGIKPISPYATKRLVRMAIKYAIKHKRPSVTFMHKGNIMKFTEGAFRNWGYELARDEFRAETVTEREWGILTAKFKQRELDEVGLALQLNKDGWEGFDYERAGEEGKKEVTAEIKNVIKDLYPTHGGEKLKDKVIVKDRIADSIFQQILTRTKEYSVIVTPNLNGDFISDAAVAQVGGLGVAAGANLGDGIGLFEATHGTAPKYADLDRVNPGALILSGVLMLDYLGWGKAAELVIKALDKTIKDRTVTYDLERLMKTEGWDNVKRVKCSEFGQLIIQNMDKV